jgi:hypothetical protein
MTSTGPAPTPTATCSSPQASTPGDEPGHPIRRTTAGIVAREHQV